jgi:hypothetical protein
MDDDFMIQERAGTSIIAAIVARCTMVCVRPDLKEGCGVEECLIAVSIVVKPIIIADSPHDSRTGFKRKERSDIAI